jgi:hypothetical protein
MPRLARSLATLAAVVALLGASSAASSPATATRADPFRHLGTWVDVFDYAPALATGGQPRLGPDSVDRMAAAGIRTLYIQAATALRPSAGILAAPTLLGQFLRRAHARGMRVVAWYAPTFASVDADLHRLVAIRDFSAGGQYFDGIGVDIEWTASVPSARARNAALVALSRRLRAATRRPLAAIVLSPVHLEVVNPAYWPNFPWRAIAPSYDAWLPMTYWTERTTRSGYREAGRYVDETVRRLRADVGAPRAPVHVIGGVGGQSSADQYRRFVAAARAHRAVGLSVYDFAITGAGVWRLLAGTT